MLFEVMRQMKWTWQDLQDTPVHVVEQVAELLALKSEVATLQDVLEGLVEG